MNSKFYNKKWIEWDDMIKYSPAPRQRRRIVKNLINNYYKDGYLLHDIGCGNCITLLEIKKKFKNIILSGSDISDVVISNNKEQYSDIKFEVMDISKEINHSGKYDIITCCEVLEHVADIKIAVKNIYTLLKPSGIVIITMPCGKIYTIDKFVGHLRHYSELSIFDGLFEVKKIIKWGFPFFNLYKWAINLKPEAVMNSFSTNKYSLFEKLISDVIYILFFFNIDIWGSQLFLVLKRHEN